MLVQIVLTLVFYAWLFAVLAFLWFIWRTEVKHIHRMETTMFDVAMTTAKAAEIAAKAAQQLADQKKSDG